MELKLTRSKFAESGIFGSLSVLNRHLYVTLEHSYDKSPKVPPGVYVCQRGLHRLSNGHEIETFEVTNVPGHSGILFHPGNRESDSSGCILLGNYETNDMIWESRAAFINFMNDVKGLNSFTLEVV